MAQILRKEYSSLEKTLQSLTNHALNQMHKRRETEQNYEILRAQNYPEHVAKALAPASEKERLSFMKMYEPNPEFQQPQQQPNAGEGGFNPNIPEDQLKEFINYLNTPEEGEQAPMGPQKPQMPGLENLLGLKPQQIPTEAPKTLQPKAPVQAAPQAAPIAQPVPQAPAQQPAKNIPALTRRGSTAPGALTQKDLVKFAREDQKLADAETKKYYDNTLALDEAADSSLKRLSKIENLVDKKGGLPISTFYKLFKKLEDQSTSSGAATGAALGTAIGLAGGPAAPGTVPVAAVTGGLIGGSVGALLSPVATVLKSAQTFTSPNTEEFEKLSTDFVREAKSIFGSRITDQDLQTFMSLVPTLSQTDNGKRAIIKNMRNFLKANQVKAKNMKKIIHANGGHRPFDLPILVEEASQPELDKLAKQFEAD